MLNNDGLVFQKSKASATANKHFSAVGNKPGIYQVTALTKQHVQAAKGLAFSHQVRHTNIVSEMIKIEVFPFLEITPGSLLLTPNMRYTL
jgi:hypothetical protein